MNRQNVEPQSRLLSGSVRIFLAESLILPTGLITTAILTRTLGPAGYGTFTLAATAVSWIEWSIAAMFARASFIHVARAVDWRPVATTLVRMRLSVSFAGAAGLALLAGPIAALLGEPALEGFLRLFAIDIPLFSAAQAHANVLVGIGAFGRRAWLTVSRVFARLVLIAALVGLGFSIEGAIWASIGASTVELIVARRFVKPHIFRRSAFPATLLWQQALPLTLFAVTTRLFDKMDLFFLQALGGSSELAGFYGGAQNLSIVPALVSMSFSPVLLSSISRLLRDGAEGDARALAMEALRWTVALVPFVAIAAAASPEIVRLVLGEAFDGAARPMSLLVFAAAAMVIVSAGTAVLMAAGKSMWAVYLTGPMVPLAAAGHVLLIPRFGASGAASVTLIVATSTALATLAAIHRLWGVVPPGLTFVRSATLSVMAYVMTAGWPAAGLMVPLKLAAVSIVVACAFLMVGEQMPAYRRLSSGGDNSRMPT